MKKTKLQTFCFLLTSTIGINIVNVLLFTYLFQDKEAFSASLISDANAPLVPEDPYTNNPKLYASNNFASQGWHPLINHGDRYYDAPLCIASSQVTSPEG